MIQTKIQKTKYKVGQTVLHKHFGKGTVLYLETDKQIGALLVIDFRGETKKIINCIQYFNEV